MNFKTQAESKIDLYLDEMTNFIYICSLAHSGSTLLSLILSQHDQAISLGELNNLSSRRNFQENWSCTCGELLVNCEYWGKFFNNLNHHQADFYNIDSEYTHIISAFNQVFGKSKYLIDTSKSIGNLSALQKRSDVNLKVIYLVKDYRSYVVSTMRKAEKQNKKARLYNYIYACRSWLSSNATIKTYLDSNNVCYFQIGYEELCLYPQESMNDIFSFLELPCLEKPDIFNVTNSHIAFGNRMRRTPSKFSSIRYDNTWFTSKLAMITSVIIPGIMDFNRQNTYGNQYGKIW